MQSFLAGALFVAIVIGPCILATLGASHPRSDNPDDTF